MQLVLLRHAIAEDADRSGPGADARRKLTREGRRKMRLGAQGLQTLVGKAERVATSPLVRSADTARIVARALGAEGVDELKALAPGGSGEELLRWLREKAPEVAVLVGHEPGLSRLAGLLVTGRDTALFTFKKGGACALSMRLPRPGSARIEWLATARTLRMLGAAHGEEDDD